MEAVLIGAGLVLALYGFLRARRADEPGRGRRRRVRPGGGADAAGADPGADLREQAMAVLRQPLNFDPEGWAGLVGASPLKQFRLGTVFGLGTGIALAGLAMVLFTAFAGPGDATAAPPAGEPPQTAGGAAAEPGPPVTPPADEPGLPADGSGEDGGGGDLVPTDGGGTGPTGGVAQPAAPLQLTFNVKSGDNAYKIAAQLKEMNVIQSEEEFINRLVERKLDTRLQAGRFQLATGMTLDQVISILAGVG